MGADQRGNNPHPVIPVTWGDDGNTYSPLSSSNPLPVTSTPAAVSSASTSTITVDTTSGGVSLNERGVGAKGVLMTNNGSVDCYISFDGTAVSGATAASHGGHLLKAGGGFLYIDNPGAIVIKGITASSSTVVAVTLFS